ncbi:MAG: hypothetical protein KatS3mg104_2980 [Phycisphaerae bacterium]|nr:MAG: hypothetical protein KatS3mg104_2980 [Phycisphaerae bacterium]
MNIIERLRGIFASVDDLPETVSIPTPKDSVYREEIEPITAFDPDMVATALERAEAGEVGELWKFYHRMGSIDPMLGGLMNHLRAALAQTPYRLWIPKGVSPSDSARFEEIFEKAFTLTDIKKAVYFMVDAHIQGAAIMTLGWSEADGFFYVSEIERVPFAAVRMIVDQTSDEYGNLGLMMEDGSIMPLSELAGEKYLFIEAEPGRYRYHMIGAARGILGWFATKQIVHRLWLDFAETYGPPWRIGMLPPMATSKDALNLKKALETLGSNAYAIIPPNAQIDLKEPNRAGTVTVYRDIMDYAHKQYAVSLIGTADIVGDNREGSYARLKVSNSIRYEFIRNVASIIEEGLTKLLHKMISVNTDISLNPAAAPRVKLKIMPPQDRLELAQSIKLLVDAGYDIPEEYIEETFNIPMVGRRRPGGVEDVTVGTEDDEDGEEEDDSVQDQ